MRALAIALLCSGCAVSARSLAIDGASYASDIVERAHPEIERLCIDELRTLDGRELSERIDFCDVAVEVHDDLVLALAATKRALADHSPDLVRLISDLTDLVAKLIKAGL